MISGLLYIADYIMHFLLFYLFISPPLGSLSISFFENQKCVLMKKSKGGITY